MPLIVERYDESQKYAAIILSSPKEVNDTYWSFNL
jgi:hypothetical protein